MQRYSGLGYRTFWNKANPHRKVTRIAFRRRRGRPLRFNARIKEEDHKLDQLLAHKWLNLAPGSTKSNRLPQNFEAWPSLHCQPWRSHLCSGLPFRNQGCHLQLFNGLLWVQSLKRRYCWGQVQMEFSWYFLNLNLNDCSQHSYSSTINIER